MNCTNHPVRQGVNTCSKCGNWLCDECSVEVDGRIICKSCISKLAGGGYTVKHEHKVTKRHDAPNILLTMMFSMLPGANYMYMGFIKRGLFVLSAFFLSAFMCEYFDIAGFVVAGIFITSFFDALSIRRKMIMGEHIHDNADDIKGFIFENKVPIIAFGVIVTALEFFSDFSRMLFVHTGGSFHGDGDGHGIIGVIILALGIYFISKGTKKRKEKAELDKEQ